MRVHIFYLLGPCQFLQNGEDEVTSVTDFCQEFVEAPIHLQTLVRLSGPPIDCPFTGEFTFTYKTGKYGKLYKNPIYFSIYFIHRSTIVS